MFGWASGGDAGANPCDGEHGFVVRGKRAGVVAAVCSVCGFVGLRWSRRFAGQADS